MVSSTTSEVYVFTPAGLAGVRREERKQAIASAIYAADGLIVWAACIWIELKFFGLA